MLFGYNQFGQCTLNQSKNKGIKQVKLGGNHSALIYLDNSVYFFGADHNMQSNTDEISLINTNGVSLGSTHSSIL